MFGLVFILSNNTMYSFILLLIFNNYALTEVSTRYGISGVKMWISYGKAKKGRAIFKFRNVQNIINIVKADVAGVANRTVHNSVLEDTAQHIM